MIDAQVALATEVTAIADGVSELLSRTAAATADRTDAAVWVAEGAVLVARLRVIAAGRIPVPAPAAAKRSVPARPVKRKR